MFAGADKRARERERKSERASERERERERDPGKEGGREGAKGQREIDAQIPPAHERPMTSLRPENQIPPNKMLVPRFRDALRTK